MTPHEHHKEIHELEHKLKELKGMNINEYRTRRDDALKDVTSLSQKILDSGDHNDKKMFYSTLHNFSNYNKRIEGRNRKSIRQGGSFISGVANPILSGVPNPMTSAEHLEFFRKNGFHKNIY